MGETDRYDNMHACENAGKKARQIEIVFLSLRDSGVGWSTHLWRAEGVRHNDCAKEINL